MKNATKMLVEELNSCAELYRSLPVAIITDDGKRDPIVQSGHSEFLQGYMNGLVKALALLWLEDKDADKRK